MKILLVLTATLGVALSAVAIAKVSGKYCEFYGAKIKVGASYFPKEECVQVSCEGKNGEATMATFYSCSPQTVSAESALQFERVERKGEPYPLCCPHYELKSQVKTNIIPDDELE